MRVGGVVLLAAAAVLLAVGSTGVWLSESYALPAPGGKPTFSTYVVHGLQRGAGQWVLAAAISLALVTLAVIVFPARLLVLMAVAAPVVAASAAIGVWLKALGGQGGVPSGVLVDLLGLAAVVPAVALLCPPRRQTRLWLTVSVAVLGAVGLLATSALSSPVPAYREFGGRPTLIQAGR